MDPYLEGDGDGAIQAMVTRLTWAGGQVQRKATIRADALRQQ